MSVTCAICETTIQLIPDGTLRYCDCRSLAVDHTDCYTRYLGTIPKEDKEFGKWWQLNSEICLEARKAFQRQL